MDIRSDIPEGPIAPLRQIDVSVVQDDGKTYAIVYDPRGYTDKQLAFAHEMLPLLTLFDGKHTIEDIAGKIKKASGEDVPLGALAEVINLLDDTGFLHNDRFLQMRKEAEEAFRTKTVRDATMVGAGYPAEADQLSHMLEHLMGSPPPEDHEPDEIPGDAPIRGIMVPHIDFARGGMTYGRTFKAQKERLPDKEQGPVLVIGIGVAHVGALSPIVVADKDYATPLGAMTVNKDAVQLIREWVGDRPFDEEFVHKAEHSLELQAVWLKHLLSEREVTFLPILAGLMPQGVDGAPAGAEELEKILDALFEIERRHDGPVLWVAGVDFAHVGPKFGETEPVSDDLTAKVLKSDMAALEQVKNVDAAGWWATVIKDDNPTRICGLNAMYLMLRALQGSKGYVLDYDQALSPDRMQMVSFAGAVFA